MNKPIKTALLLAGVSAAAACAPKAPPELPPAPPETNRVAQATAVARRARRSRRRSPLARDAVHLILARPLRADRHVQVRPPDEGLPRVRRTQCSTAGK